MSYYIGDLKRGPNLENYSYDNSYYITYDGKPAVFTGGLHHLLPHGHGCCRGIPKSITPAKQRKVCGVFLSFWGCSVQEDVGSGYKFWPHAHKRHEELHEVMAAKAGD